MKKSMKLCSRKICVFRICKNIYSRGAVWQCCLEVVVVVFHRFLVASTSCVFVCVYVCMCLCVRGVQSLRKERETRNHKRIYTAPASFDPTSSQIFFQLWNFLRKLHNSFGTSSSEQRSEAITIGLKRPFFPERFTQVYVCVLAYTTIDTNASLSGLLPLSTSCSLEDIRRRKNAC